MEKTGIGNLIPINVHRDTIVGSVLSILDVLAVRLRWLVLATSVSLRMQIGIIPATAFILFALWAVPGYGAEPTINTLTQPSETQVRPDSERTPALDELKRAYGDVKTLEASFQQKIFIASLKRERESKGAFLFKRQKGFLWRYKSPKVQFFLFDGKYLWQGEEDKPFVTREKINKEKTRGTFFDLIEDIARIDELFSLKEVKMAGEMELFELIPKKEGTVNSAKVWIDRQKRVRKIEIHEFTGNINVIEFSGIKVNQPVDDGKFVYKRDNRKEIIER
ncbi:MAG: Outer-membrane lipoprotein carrier protein precursor [Syntrophorhabdus sp. PtaU1.Bin153]|nr:MAG: Outer-membrane lipoprotein carrier protein precursor [Syntrophorhabdus sp. PtaU1.Bin153]